MSHTTRLAFLGKGASFLAIFLVQLLVVYLVVTVTGNRRPSKVIYYDLERGHGSAKSLFEQAKEEGTVIALEETQR